MLDISKFKLFEPCFFDQSYMNEDPALDYRLLLGNYGSKNDFNVYGLLGDMSLLLRREFRGNESLDRHFDAHDAFLDQLGITSDERRRLGSRVPSHLYRLGTPSSLLPNEVSDLSIDEEDALKKEWDSKLQNSVTPQFAYDFISAFREEVFTDSLMERLGDENEEVFSFWTIAPWMYQIQKDRGFDTLVSMKMISLHLESYHFLDVPSNLSIRNRLGPDERMPSHFGVYVMALDLLRK